MIAKGQVSDVGLRKARDGSVIRKTDKAHAEYPGVFDYSTSLIYLLSSLDDFKFKTTQMQYIADQLGFTVVLTPKAHPELAGMGIEYAWGYAKNVFWRVNDTNPASLNRHIRSSLKEVNLLRMRKFARKAHDYKVVYHHRFEGDYDLDKDNEADKNKAMGYEMIEKMVKSMKKHRCALDMDHSFIINA